MQQSHLHRRELVVSALRHVQVFVEHEVELFFVLAATAGHLLAGRLPVLALPLLNLNIFYNKNIYLLLDIGTVNNL